MNTHHPARTYGTGPTPTVQTATAKAHRLHQPHSDGISGSEEYKTEGGGLSAQAAFYLHGGRLPTQREDAHALLRGHLGAYARAHLRAARRAEARERGIAHLG